jgi:abortive infection bacteriophage resistance protein
MKKSFHIKIMEPFFLNTRKEITKMPKVYYFDNGLRNVVLNLFEPIELRVDREKSAFEVKYNAGLLKKGKYAGFMKLYPDFAFHLVYHQGDSNLEDKDIKMLQI